MSDRDFVGVKIGPVIVGQSTERKPKTREDRKAAWICWIITMILIAQVSPFLGVILVLATAIYAAAHSAPSDPQRERTQP